MQNKRKEVEKISEKRNQKMKRICIREAEMKDYLKVNCTGM